MENKQNNHVTFKNNIITINYTKTELEQLEKPKEYIFNLQEIEIFQKKTIQFIYDKNSLKTFETTKIGIFEDYSIHKGNKIQIKDSKDYSNGNTLIETEICSCKFSERNQIDFKLCKIVGDISKTKYLQISFIFTTPTSSTLITDEIKKKIFTRK